MPIVHFMSGIVFVGIRSVSPEGPGANGDANIAEFFGRGEAEG
jgi:hypothetical protein